MTAGFVAAVDLGATSGRVVVGLVGPDVLETAQIARFPNEPVRRTDGLHWDVFGLYRASLDGLQAAVRSDSGLVSIGIDSWGVDYGLIRGRRLLGEPFHYRDSRTTTGAESVHRFMSHKKLFARNGLQFLPFNTLYQLATEPPELLRQVDGVLLIPDLFGFWLTGQARAEVTNASTTGLLRTGPISAPNLADKSWDYELIDALHFPRGLFPPLICPGTELGRLTPELGRSIGTSTAVVTAVASHDTASAVVAVPMQPDAAAFISCGTWALVGVEIAQAIQTPSAREAGFTNEAGADGRIRFLRNVMGLWILSEAIRAWERVDGGFIDLTGLLKSASEVPANTVPLFDVNDPSFLAPGDMADRVHSWCRDHDQQAPRARAEYVRSIIESLARAFAEAAIQSGEVAGVEIRTIHIVGGGALNELLCQRTADRAGTPVMAGPVEATALGNLLVQARSTGFLSGSLETLRDLVARTHSVRPHLPKS